VRSWEPSAHVAARCSSLEVVSWSMTKRASRTALHSPAQRGCSGHRTEGGIGRVSGPSL
jgi:hypothetical protein